MVLSEGTGTPSLHTSANIPTAHGVSRPAHSQHRIQNQPASFQKAIKSNEWKAAAGEFSVASYYDPLDEEDSAFLTSDDERWRPPTFVSSLIGIRLTRRVKRVLIVLSLLLLPFWAAWKFHIQPHWRLQTDIEQAFIRQAERERTSIGRMSAHAEVLFKDTILLHKLDPIHLPGKSHGKHAEAKRLIFVGDVHGCKNELVRLLKKVEFSQDHDHLIMTGDVVSKGPDSPGTVDLARELGASCVRGNWDDRVLVAWSALHGRKFSVGKEEAESVEENQLVEEDRARLSTDRAYTTALKLNKEQIKWLRSCPCILDLGYVEGVGRMVTVHAGLAPGVPLRKQDPYAVMNMRTIDLRTLAPLEGRAGVEWDKVWESQQKRLPENERVTIVYGHDSKRGLNMMTWSKGLDTGCVNGGKLTALILEAGGQMKLESVRCRVDYKDRNKDEAREKDKNRISWGAPLPGEEE